MAGQSGLGRLNGVAGVKGASGGQALLQSERLIHIGLNMAAEVWKYGCFARVFS